MTNAIKQLHPDYYQDIEEFSALADTEDATFKNVDNYLSEQLNNAFISTANGTGVDILEDAYNIPTNSNRSIDDRKSQIKLRQLPPQPMTLKYFKYMLNNLGLSANIVVDTDKLTLTAYIDTDSYTDTQISRLSDVMATYLPANIETRIYRYQHGKTTLNNYIGVANSVHFHAHTGINLKGDD